jgi:hypothetical protein
MDGFRPLLIKHILEDDPFAPHWIGGSTETHPPDPGTEHDLQMYTVMSEQNERIIVAKMRLFAYEPTPTYTVVVGIALAEPRADSTIF